MKVQGVLSSSSDGINIIYLLFISFLINLNIYLYVADIGLTSTLTDDRRNIVYKDELRQIDSDIGIKCFLYHYFGFSIHNT
jgi:hypothetical protein